MPYAGQADPLRPNLMATAKKTKTEKGMESLKVSVPRETAEWFRARAAKEGIAIQAVTAPVLNAFARGEIKQEFSQAA